ncbi:Pao retrotransposon peptidase family protein, partial [Aphelenchoides avenae]
MYCALCDGSTHFPRQCVEYVTVEQRSERADELDLCLRCLRGPRGHACTDFCYICKGDHEKALCTVHDSSKHARPCVFCHGQHWDCHCPQYKTVEERIAQAEKVDVCTRCLTVRHPRNERCHLVDRVCYYCQSSDHNKALCPVNAKLRRNSGPAEIVLADHAGAVVEAQRGLAPALAAAAVPEVATTVVVVLRAADALSEGGGLAHRLAGDHSQRGTPTACGIFTLAKTLARPYKTLRMVAGPRAVLQIAGPTSEFQVPGAPQILRVAAAQWAESSPFRRPTCKCVFCGDWHWNEACTVIRSAEEREKFLKDGGHCLRCTRLGHRTENCYSKGVHRPCCGCGSTSHITPLCPEQFPSDNQSTSASASFEDAPRTFGEMVARRQSERQSADDSGEAARRESPTRASPSTRRSPVSTRNSAWKPYQPPTAPQGVENPTVSSTDKATDGSPAAVVASVPPSPVPDDEHLFGFRSSIGFASPTNAIVPTWPSTSSDRPYRDSASSDDIEVLNEVQRERKPGEKEKERKKHDEDKRERRKKSKSRESDDKRSKKKKKKKERDNSTERDELEEIKAQLAKEKNELATLRTSLEATERGVQEREAHVSQRERQAQQKEETSKAENARLAEEREKLEDEK